MHPRVKRVGKTLHIQCKVYAALRTLSVSTTPLLLSAQAWITRISMQTTGSM